MNSSYASGSVQIPHDTVPSTIGNEAAHGEVAGSFLLGLIQSFYNLHTLPQGGMALDIGQIAPERWYPHSLLIDTLRNIETVIPSSDSLFFRAGIHFLRIWYEHGPGKTMIHSSLDWLHANDKSGGYNSVVRGGGKEDIGWCLVQSIDEEAGIAVIENVTPLPMEFVKGVFYGGCLIFDDLEYVSVEGASEPYEGNPTFNKSYITVRFRLKPTSIGEDFDDCIDALQSGSSLTPTPLEVESLVWRYKWGHYQRNLDVQYFNDISTVLAQATAEQQRISKELEAANRELSSVLRFSQSILLNSPLPMAVYNASGPCVEANEAYAELIGSSREAALAQKFHSIRSWQESGLLNCCLVALARKEPQRREARVTTTFGKDIYLECRFLPIELHGEGHVLVQIVDLTERKHHEEELRSFAFNDVLTSLPNRRLLLDRLGQALHTSKRLNSYGAVLFLDLDKFKQLNDAHGHEAGDQLLVEVAKRLKEVTRDTDTVARLGGDEFVVLMEGIGTDATKATEHAALMAEKIRGSLTKEYVIGELRYHGSASIGVTLFLGDARDPDQLINEADAAMYEVKRARVLAPKIVLQEPRGVT